MNFPALHNNSIVMKGMIQTSKAYPHLNTLLKTISSSPYFVQAIKKTVFYWKATKVLTHKIMT